jgi:cyclopropane-fatty-acyl-phospholipid synthase
MRRIEQAAELNLNWPHLRSPARAPMRAALARRALVRSVRELKLQVVRLDGRFEGAGQGDFRDGGDPAIRIVNARDFFTRLGRDGALGFGESYLAGAWHAGRASQDAVAESDELVEWLRIYSQSLRGRPETPRWLRKLWQYKLPISELNTAAGARRNVSAHYDLSPQLFELFLDPSMAYSSAFFSEFDDLASAQLRKVDAVLDLARVKRGTRMLDIGSGFGGLAMRAAQTRRANVTAITLSASQHAYSLKKSDHSVSGQNPRFLLEDYRNHVGDYDAITCVEMIEAVGKDYWAQFFQCVEHLLAAGGYFALQAVTFPHSRMLSASGDFSWVDRYIFPGGALPSLRELDRIMRDSTSLEIVEARRLTDSYARTLRSWRLNFINADKTIEELGFDATFRRLWVLYFAYFEAGFRARYCDVWQLAIVKSSCARRLSEAPAVRMECRDAGTRNA